MGGCTKALIAARIGYQPTSGGMDRMGVLFAEGDLHEETVVKRLEIEEYVVSDRQRELSCRIDTKAQITVQGHIDGILTGHPFGPYLLEIKSMGVKEYGQWLKTRWDTPGLIQKYKWQVSFYMNCLQMPLFFVVKNRNNGQVDKSTVTDPFYSLLQISERIEGIEQAAAEGELPETCDWRQWPCPFSYLEEDSETAVAVAATTTTIPGVLTDHERTIEQLAIEYDKCRAAVKAATLEREEAQQALLTAAGSSSMVVGRARVTQFEGVTEFVDRDKMIEDGVWGKYRKETMWSGLRVSVKKLTSEVAWTDKDGVHILENEEDNE